MANASVNSTEDTLYSSAMYYSIGSLMSMIMVIGVLTNSAILFTYSTQRKIRTVNNTLIVGLALCDIGVAIFVIPFVAIASFSKRWIFGHAFCQYNAFITTMFGISQICMLSLIAIEKYYVIVRRDRRLSQTPCRCVIVIIFSFIYGSFWATGPVVGWSGYKEEDIGIACCVKWEVKDTNALSYTITICTFGWLIPMILIVSGYTNIAYLIHKEGKKKQYLNRKAVPNKSNRERKVAFTVLMMIGAFFVSWTPYAVVSLWSAIGNFHTIPLWAQVAPAVFAKCSIIWNPLIYVARHRHFREGVCHSMSPLIFWNKKDNAKNAEVNKSLKAVSKRQSSKIKEKSRQTDQLLRNPMSFKHDFDLSNAPSDMSTSSSTSSPTPSSTPSSASSGDSKSIANSRSNSSIQNVTETSSPPCWHPLEAEMSESFT